MTLRPRLFLVGRTLARATDANCPPAMVRAANRVNRRLSPSVRRVAHPTASLLAQARAEMHGSAILSDGTTHPWIGGRTHLTLVRIFAVLKEAT